MSSNDEAPDHKPRPVAGEAAARPRGARGRAPVAALRTERRFPGIPVGPGIAIGEAFPTTEPPAVVERRKIAASDMEAEIKRLDAAIAQSRKQLTKLRARLAVLPEDSQAEIEPLIDAYYRMLGPSRLTRGIRKRVTDGLVNAETAVLDEAEAIAQAILAIHDNDRAGTARRAEEVREIGRRVIRNLTRAPFRSFAGLPDGAILVAEALRPADAALLNPARLGGVAADWGGADDHTAVMLRALGVPAVLGAEGLSDAIRPGDTAIVDGSAGVVVLNPSLATLAHAKRGVAAFAREAQRLARLRPLPSVTLDNQGVELQANFELLAELPLIEQANAAGIGLLRSEFMFMNRETLPDEDEQAETYRQVIEAMHGHSVTIRVLDWGGEKEIEALVSEGIVPELLDPNPALGLRGIRLLLRHMDLFETQLAAILRAATAGPTRVLLPMVTNLAEVRTAREAYERVARRLRRRGERLPDPLPPLGIMIETPGAALSADALALEADFFAIGTNDLAMYTLAVDRADSEVSGLYDPLHPSVLRLVQFAAEAALTMRKPVSVCGEIAANPKLTPLLLGLGLRSFSMNPAAILRVKQVVRQVEMGDCVRFARRVLEQSDPARIAEMVLAFGEDGG